MTAMVIAGLDGVEKFANVHSRRQKLRSDLTELYSTTLRELGMPSTSPPWKQLSENGGPLLLRNAPTLKDLAKISRLGDADLKAWEESIPRLRFELPTTTFTI
jgi:hypothetical protein